MAKTFERTIKTYVYRLGVVKMEGGNLITSVTRTVEQQEKLSTRGEKKLCHSGERVLLVEEKETLYRCTVEDFLKVAQPVIPEDKSDDNNT